jgi:DDE superfamily endonuclease
MSTRLVVPPNITIIALPPKCPELNPVENVWQFMRDNWLSNRVFKSYDDLVDHCCEAWNKLVWLHRHQPVATSRAGRRLLQQARDVRAMDQGRQGRHQVDAAVMLLVRRRFRRGRLLMVSPDSRGTACPPSGRNSTYRPVQISGTGSLVDIFQPNRFLSFFNSERWPVITKQA